MSNNHILHRDCKHILFGTMLTIPMLIAILGHDAQNAYEFICFWDMMLKMPMNLYEKNLKEL